MKQLNLDQATSVEISGLAVELCGQMAHLETLITDHEEVKKEHKEAKDKIVKSIAVVKAEIERQAEGA